MRRWNGSYLLGLGLNKLGLGFQVWGSWCQDFPTSTFQLFNSSTYVSYRKNNKFNATGHKYSTENLTKEVF